VTVGQATTGIDPDSRLWRSTSLRKVRVAPGAEAWWRKSILVEQATLRPDTTVMKRPTPKALHAAALSLLALGLLQIGCFQSVALRLGPPSVVSEGVHLYVLSDPSVLDPPGPVSIHLLRLDPVHVRLQVSLGQDEVMGSETVAALARRNGALAAVNGGFFTQGGEPAGILKTGGDLVSDTTLPRGAVGIMPAASGRPQQLVFDRVSVSAALRIEGEQEPIPISGIDTTRLRGRLMLFTPRYHANTDTAPGGTEWAVGGSPLTVRERRDNVGKTPIPPDGFVLSFGGRSPPPSLDALAPGQGVKIPYSFNPTLGTAATTWERAADIVGGAGLLIFQGRLLVDWESERLRPNFVDERHPRTMIGVDRRGNVWLVAVDGRQPQLSLGMTLPELQRLARKLRLSDALNLDGGGSTTMVVRGSVVNSPSDPTGPRKVSDAVLVFPAR
jgi:hypothetical protein